MERFKFSKTSLIALSLPEQGKRRTVYDTEVQRLALRITSAGSKTFYIVKRTGTNITWIKLDTFPDMTVEQARKQAETIMGEFAGGTNRATVKRALRKEPTFDEVFKDFLISKRKRSGKPLADKTKKDYLDLLRLHLSSLSKTKMSEVTRASIKALHTTITRKSTAQADKAIAVIGAVFTFAIDREIFVGVNPASRIQKNEAISRDRFVTAEELPHVLGAIMESTQRDFFLLALLTGARRSNIQSMAWRDLDLKSKVWRIPTTKNGDPQVVPLGLEAVTVLSARKELSEQAKRADRSVYVFPGTGESGHLVEPKTAWAKILKCAGLLRLKAMLKVKATDDLLALAAKNKIKPEEYEIRDLRPHDLRRTLGSWQAINNSSLAIIGKSLGHKTHQATAIYARLSMDPVRQSVGAATASMLNAAGVKQGADVIPIDRARRAG
jgi:integrase